MEENRSQPKSKKAPHTDLQVLIFIIVLCFASALILAVVAYVLQGPQKNAKEFDRSKQMLIAAKVLNHNGYFEILEENGAIVPAKFNSEKKILVPVKEGEPPQATEEAIKQIAELRIRPLVTDKEGKVYTLEEKNLTLGEYLEKNKKTGYATLPLKLFYAILPNDEKAEQMSASDVVKHLSDVSAFVIPVSGFGLWAPIYGYLAIAPNGEEVIGTTWYEQAETPGLGANIAESWWQQQFYGKDIFQQTTSGAPDLKTADIGITVVKGQVKDVFGSSPRAKSAVDGISGATLTGDGVTAAYRNSLTPYRNFFINIHNQSEGEQKKHG